MSRFLVTAVVVLATAAAALATNAILVDATTRAALARSGGRLMDTGIVTANVRVEGEGSPIVLIHGFGAALDGGTRSRRSSPAITASSGSI